MRDACVRGLAPRGAAGALELDALVKGRVRQRDERRDKDHVDQRIDEAAQHTTRMENGASAKNFSRRRSSKPAIVMGVSGEVSTNA